MAKFECDTCGVVFEDNTCNVHDDSCRVSGCKGKVRLLIEYHLFVSDNDRSTLLCQACYEQGFIEDINMDIHEAESKFYYVGKIHRPVGSCCTCDF